MTLTVTGVPAPVLDQYVTTCPCCAGAAAAHVDATQQPPVLVRLVCHEGCAVDSVAVLRQLDLMAGTHFTAA